MASEGTPRPNSWRAVSHHQTVSVCKKWWGIGSSRRQADGLFLIRQRSFRSRTPKGTLQLSSDGALVVRDPRVVPTGMNDGQCPRHHRRAELCIADTLESDGIPLHRFIRIGVGVAPGALCCKRNEVRNPRAKIYSTQSLPTTSRSLRHLRVVRNGETGRSLCSRP